RVGGDLLDQEPPVDVRELARPWGRVGGRVRGCHPVRKPPEDRPAVRPPGLGGEGCGQPPRPTPGAGRPHGGGQARPRPYYAPPPRPTAPFVSARAAVSYHSPRGSPSAASTPRSKSAAVTPTRTVTRSAVLSHAQSRTVSGDGPSPAADTHAAGSPGWQTSEI